MKPGDKVLRISSGDPIIKIGAIGTVDSVYRVFITLVEYPGHAFSPENFTDADTILAKEFNAKNMPRK